MNKAFCESVYEITKRIPKGKVATYGQIASLAGNPKAARAVGMCMKTNPHVPIIPCHRVVSSDGKLTGYSTGEGLRTKKDMLMQEGVEFIDDRVNLIISKWNPQTP